MIGASGQTLTVQFQIINIFEPDNQIWVYFPYWNPRSPTPLHMIASNNPTCFGVAVLLSNLPCIYDQTDRILKITNSVYNSVADGTVVSFSVDHF